MSDSRYLADLHAHFCESCDGCYPCQGTVVETVCQSAVPCVECGAAPDATRVIAVRAANA